MVWDWSVFVSSLVASMVTITGSLAVAWLYIRNENKKFTLNLINKKVQDTFFRDGIQPIESALVSYGLTTAFSIMDVQRNITNCFIQKKMSQNDLEARLKEIGSRDLVADLVSRNFRLSMNAIPNIQRFGSEIFNAVGQTFQFYSDLLQQVLDTRVIEEHVARAKNKEDLDDFIRSLLALASFANLTQGFIGKRLESIRDYVWKSNFKDYVQFENLFKDDKYTKFSSAFVTYVKYLNDFTDSLNGRTNAKDRGEISKEFSKWLQDERDKNILAKES
jgi:hypothetical protein